MTPVIFSNPIQINWSQRWLSVLLLSLWTCLAARAQHENDTWYFGNRAGLSFASGQPVVLTDGALVSGEGCASSSDAQGQLQFYTNGISVWNRQHQIMPGGSSIGGYTGPSETVPNSATQGALIVPRPGSATEYYVFTVDAAENGLRDGLQYAVVDMSAQGGLGQVVSQHTRLPTPTPTGRVTEKLAGLRLANGADSWVLVHGWESNAFMAFRVTAAGVAAAPVVSTVGAVHQGGGNARNDYNALGYLKFSPDGRRLAVARYSSPELEVFDFNPQTGSVATPQTFFLLGGTYGVEFSSSGRLLYAAGYSLRQIDLQTGQITVVGVAQHSPLSLLLGPDRRVYVRCGASQQAHLEVIDFPDLPGAQCGYRPVGVLLGAGASNVYSLGLPNNLVFVRSAPPTLPLGITATGTCLGQASTLSAVLLSARTDLRLQWNFGDPGSGQPTATGPTVQHVFSRPGTYTVTLQAFEPGSTTPLGQASLPVTVVAAPTQPLLPRVLLLCPNEARNISLVWAPQTQYRWQDGTSSSYAYISRPGLYWVEANTGGCIRRDTMRVAVLNANELTLGADTLVCPAPYLTLRVRPQLPGMKYLWSDGSTGAERTITESGEYSVQITSTTGTCAVTLRRRVDVAQYCLAQLPNIITPNGDGRNDALVLPGLSAADYDIDIYDRWGQRVYAKAGYDNGWQAEGLPAGLYYFLLRHRSTTFRYRGWVEVVR